MFIKNLMFILNLYLNTTTPECCQHSVNLHHERNHDLKNTKNPLVIEQYSTNKSLSVLLLLLI